MRELPSLWMYPVSRLTVAMMAGIGLADSFLKVCGKSWLDASYSIGTCLVSLPQLMLLGTFVLVFLGIGTLYCYRARHGNSLWTANGFGVLVMLAGCLWGALRLCQVEARIEYPWSKERQVYWGRVLSPPVLKDKVFHAEVQIEGSACLHADSVGLDPYVPIHRTILWYGRLDSIQRPPVCGDEVILAAKVTQPVSDVEVTGFDYGAYLFRKGISGTAMAYQGDWRICHVVDEKGMKPKLTLKQGALRCREWVTDRYRSWNLGEEELAVVAALTVGDKGILTEDLKERYSAAGVSHVLALSGLHVGILSAVLLVILAPLKRWKRGERLRSFLVVLALWGFAFVTGLSPSVVRAVAMCSLYFVATCLVDGRFPANYVLVLAAFLMLSYQPLYLFDLSCQLSFVAVGSILYFYPLLSGCIHVKNRLLTWAWNGMAVSMSAQLGTLPLILLYFGTFPTYFLLANLIVSVLAGAVLCGAIVALLTSWIPWLGEWTVAFLTIVTEWMNDSMRWVQHLSGAQLQGISVSWLQSLCGFVVLWALYKFVHHRRPLYVVVLMLGINVSLVEWAVRPLEEDVPTVFLYHAQVYLKQHRQVTELVSSNGLYQVDTLRVAVIRDEQWKNKQSTPLIPVDYVYVCRGFKGSLQQLLHVFQIRQVVLDTSLSDWRRERLRQECEELHIPCREVSEKASFKIHL